MPFEDWLFMILCFLNGVFVGYFTRLTIHMPHIYVNRHFIRYLNEAVENEDYEERQ